MREIKFRYRTNYGKHDWEYFTIPTDKYLEEARDIAEWETLGLFTGLKDKNGVEIYEGDIVNFNYKGGQITGSVDWSQNNSAFGIKNGEYYEMLNGIISLEVIGNVYDNPDLLDN